MIHSAKQKGTQKLYRQTAAVKNCNHSRSLAVIYSRRGAIITEGHVDMYEGVFRSRRHGDSGLVAAEFSTGDRPHPGRSGRFRERKLVLLLLGGALCACADDSTPENPNHHKHRHGNGHGREQVETVDRSGDSDHSSPAPASTPGW